MGRPPVDFGDYGLHDDGLYEPYKLFFGVGPRSLVLFRRGRPSFDVFDTRSGTVSTRPLEAGLFTQDDLPLCSMAVSDTDFVTVVRYENLIEL